MQAPPSTAAPVARRRTVPGGAAAVYLRRSVMTSFGDAPPWVPREEEVADAYATTGPHLLVTPAGTIQPSRPTWLWHGWLVRGAVHLLIGRQGAGKSTYVAWLIAALTTGRPLPGDTVHYEPVRCALLSLEEPADRLVARLTAAGADLDHVVILGDVEDHDDDGRPSRRAWRLPKDAGVLEAALGDKRIGFAAIDGLGYAITGDGGYSAVGSALTGLASVAERTGAAILGMTHPPKAAADPTTAAIGSTAWTSVARLAWILGLDPGDESRRVVQLGKSNFKLPDAGVAFTIATNDRYEVGYVDDVATSHVEAEALVAGHENSAERSDREEAGDLLRSILASGPVSSGDVQKTTRSAGISDRTVARARKDLGVVAAARHDPNTGRMIGWELRLPDQPATPQCQSPTGTLGTLAATRNFTTVSGPERHLSEHGALDSPDASDSVPPTACSLDDRKPS
ncbi:MAG: AAA family ATPase [Acidimicrobiales bacterium]